MLFWILIKITVFFISNSNNQELIHHIHCLQYTFHQSMVKKLFSFHRFLFYGFYFGFYSSNDSIVNDSAKHHCIHYGLLSQQYFHSYPLLFLFSPPSYTKNEYIFGFNPTNSSIAIPLASPVILPTINLFESA